MIENEKKEKTTKISIILTILAMILIVAATIIVFSNSVKMENDTKQTSSTAVGTLEESTVPENQATTEKSENQENPENPEDAEEDANLEYYDTVVLEELTADGKKEFRIVNKYKGPVISAEKEVKTATDLGYVVEGEEIEYTIIAKNAGDIEKDVVIKDPIVEGLEFIEGSIKVNGESNYTLGETTIDLSLKTADDLTNGITVKVPAKTAATEEATEKLGETRLSFKAKIKALEGEDLTNLQKTIVNKATVDDAEAEETVVVKKADVKSGKTATIKKAVATRNADEESKTTVEKGDEITYIITVKNDGTAKAIVNVQDTVPTGTTYVEDSTKIINGDNTETAITIEELSVGKEIEVEVGETKQILFTVIVNDIDNDTIIKNVATVNEDKPEVEHKYVEPIIGVKKTVTKEDGSEIKNPNYVLEGQTIKYRITVENTGSKETEALVQDTIPEGLTLVEGSIIVNSEERLDLGKADLENGITIYVPSKTETIAEDGSKTVIPGQVKIEFKVTVDELLEGILTKTIKNIATVIENDTPHEDEVDVTVNKPDLHVSKSVFPEEGTKVKTGDKITYTILLDNSTGTASTIATVRDSTPKGTTFTEEVRILKDDIEEETKTEEELKNGIAIELQAGETKSVVFRVIVGNKEGTIEEEKIHDGEIIENTANVNGEDTNLTKNPYIEPIITSKKEVTTEKNLGYVVKGEKVSYKITAENAGGLAKKLTIQDTLSSKLTLIEGSIIVRINGVEQDIAKDLENGINVTVPEKVGETNGTVIITFDATVNNDASGEITNIALIDEEEKEAKKLPIVTFAKTAEIVRTTEPAQTIEEGNVTANDEIIYKINVTNSGEEAAKEVAVIDTIPDGTKLKENSISDEGSIADNKDIAWTITNLEPGQTKELNFTVIVNYSEKDRTIENTAYIAGTPTDKITIDYEKPEGRIDNNITKYGTDNITKEDEEVTYDINYDGTIYDYVGDAVVTITDILPYAIDEEKSDLTSLGEKGVNYNYDEATHTIIWTNTITGIDTYKNGPEEVNVAKQIKIVYVNMDYSKTTFTNTAKGKITLNYLEDEEPVEYPEVTATKDTTTDFRTEIKITKEWNHTNNIYEIPKKVTIQLLADGVVAQEQVLTTENKLENDENIWKYTFENLIKYDAKGKEINYTVSEKK